MNKKILTFLVTITVLCLSSLLYTNTAKAEAVANMIQIVQQPTKTIYMSGETIDTTGMLVQSYYIDGTSAFITDYTIEGFNSNLIGPQTITVHYQNCYAYFTITMQPSKVRNIKTSTYNTSSFTITWDAVMDTVNYEIYHLDPFTGSYSLIATTQSNSYTVVDLPAAVHSYMIRVVKDIGGVQYVSEFSDVYTACTSPEKVLNLQVVTTTTNSIQLSWDAVNGATGYIVYRYLSAATGYVYCGSTLTNSFTDLGLSSGKGVYYKVSAYTLQETFAGEASDIVKTCTNPAMVVLKSKAGDQKIRLKWAKVTGATSYDLYVKTSLSEYTLLTTNLGNASCTYIHEGLATGETYFYYAVARRDLNGLRYDSPASMEVIVTVNELEATSTIAKFFDTEDDFIKSNAYKKIPYFRDNVNYSKSFIIPGLINTNVGGFTSTNMCPQGITFAEDYLLLTAYDLKDEENSVIYVIDKNTQELLTTLILPDLSHVGGICYDGENVWITRGTRASAFTLDVVDEAVNQEKEYVYIEFHTTSKLGITASYIAYYDDKLWVGSYDELKTTYMHSFQIDYEEKETGNIVYSLTKVDTVLMPTRVQGIAFMEDGRLILSRSCQLYQGLRGYMRRIDVYQPTYSLSGNVTVKLNKVVNYVYTPSMNEGIAIDGSYLYVAFESAAFTNASYTVDRICAFPLKSVLKKIIK